MDERHQSVQHNPSKNKPKGIVNENTPRFVQSENVNANVHSMVKSPSDTTIYSPGLRKVNRQDVSLIEKISNFVESIRLEDRNSNSHQRSRRVDSGDVSYKTPLASPRTGQRRQKGD